MKWCFYIFVEDYRITMTISVNNVQSKNINQLSQKKQVVFKASSSKTLSNDTVEISTNKNGLSKGTKWSIGLGSFALALIGGVIGIRKYKASYIEKAQKTFQEVFMRDDITKEETIKMLKRYKDIQKIKNKEEYAKAIFKEAKKNYGFEKFENVSMEFDKTSDKFMGDSLGQALYNGEIRILSESKREQLINSIHHELRHQKQHFYSLNYDIDKTIENFLYDAEPIFKKYINKESLEKMWNMKFDKSNVPEKYYEFAQKCIENLKNHIKADVDINGYKKQFVEADAYKAGDSIDKLLKGFIPV